MSYDFFGKVMKNLLFLLLTLSFVGCSNLLYHPDDIVYSTPKQFNLDYKDLYFNSKDGTKLHAWLLETKAKKKKGLVVFFHGNAQNLSSHYLSLAWMVNKDYDLLVFDYRGYGKSEGEPNPKDVNDDAISALEYGKSLFDKGKYPRFIVYAQSLGGVIALRGLKDFSARSRVDLLVLDSTFSSYQEIARDRVSQVWFLWPIQHLTYLLMSDEYASYDYIEQFDRPALVIHSKEDQVIPLKFGEEIYQKLKVKKDMWVLEGVPHIGTYHGNAFKERERLLNYLEKLSQ